MTGSNLFSLWATSLVRSMFVETDVASRVAVRLRNDQRRTRAAAPRQRDDTPARHHPLRKRHSSICWSLLTASNRQYLARPKRFRQSPNGFTHRRLERTGRYRRWCETKFQLRPRRQCVKFAPSHFFCVRPPTFRIARRRCWADQRQEWAVFFRLTNRRSLGRSANLPSRAQQDQDSPRIKSARKILLASRTAAGCRRSSACAAHGPVRR